MIMIIIIQSPLILHLFEFGLEASIFFVDGVEIFLGRGEWCKETSPPADDEILDKLLIAQLLRSHMVKKQSTTGDHINKIAYY